MVLDKFHVRPASEVKGQVNFLIQAFLYSRKANYRDSIFLSYGDNNQDKMDKFINDLLAVSFNFIKTISYYCSKRVEKGTWDLFINDIEANTRLSVDLFRYKNITK